MVSIIWNSLVDHIPLWGWIVIFGAPAIVALYYLSPILLPIWNMLPTPVKVVLGGAMAGLLAYLGGRYKGRRDAEDEQKRRDQIAIQKRSQVDDKVNKLPEGQAEKELRSKWGID